MSHAGLTVLWLGIGGYLFVFTCAAISGALWLASSLAAAFQ